MTEPLDFEKDCMALVITFGAICGVKPDAFVPIIVRMLPALSELRAKWVAELDTVLAHAMRDRDAYKANLDEAQAAGSKLVYRVQDQANAIALASMALSMVDPGTTLASQKHLKDAKIILEGAMP